MTIEQLYEIIKQQQIEIDALKNKLTALKEWSDLNDYWLREMIDALTDTVDNNIEKICQCNNRCKRNHNEEES